MITSRPPTAVTTAFVVTPALASAGLNRVGDDAGVHDFAFDDRVGEERRDRHANELRLALRVIDRPRP